MKRFILPLAAVFCSSFTASALDATDVRVWMTKNAEITVSSKGNGISGDKSPTFARTWQYVSIPLRVEARIKGGDVPPHFVHAMKVHVYVLFALEDKDKYVLLDKELNYTDIPLASKQSDKGSGTSTINVGVFISPSSAFKLLPGKDGDLSKSVAAVAIEATFNDATCTRSSGDANITQSIIKNKQLGSKLSDKWWRSKSSFKNDCGAVLCSIAETPYAAQYESLGMAPLAPMYGGGSAAPASSSSTGGSSTSASDSDSDSGGPVNVTDSDASDASATDEEESSTRGNKRGKRNKGGKKRR